MWSWSAVDSPASPPPGRRRGTAAACCCWRGATGWAAAPGRLRWNGHQIEYGGGWVHWHQPHTFSEITRAGLTVELSGDPDVTAWYVGERAAHRARSPSETRSPNRGWLQFVDGVERSLPNPHDPTLAIERLARIDGLTIAQRVDELDLDDEHREVLWAELESLAHGPLDEAGAVSVLRWHALSGYSLALTQYTGGRVTLTNGTRGLLEAIAGGAAYETRLGTPVAAVRRRGDGVEVETRDRRAAAGGAGGGGRAAEHARRDRVRAGAVGAEAGGDRPGPGLARDQDLHPRRRRADLPERDPAGAPVRLPRHRVHERRRHAGDDRLRLRRRR